MSVEPAARLRAERDLLAAQLEQLRASIVSLRAQHAEEAGIGAAAEGQLDDQTRRFAEARSKSDALRVRYHELVSEERSLRERIENLRAARGE